MNFTKSKVLEAIDKALLADKEAYDARAVRREERVKADLEQWNLKFRSGWEKFIALADNALKNGKPITHELTTEAGLPSRTAFTLFEPVDGAQMYPYSPNARLLRLKAMVEASADDVISSKAFDGYDLEAIFATLPS